MWSFTPAARAALAGEHTAVSRVDVWHGGAPSGVTLEVLGGSVSVDADRPVRRNLGARLVDPTGALSTGDVDDLLDPYECEIVPYRGVRTPAGDELAPQGVFGLTGRRVSDSPDGLLIELTGQDRAMGYQGPMASALAIPAGTPLEVAVRRLLATRHPGVTLRALATGITVGPLLYGPDVDVWAEAQRLATAAGARLFHDRTGEAVLARSGPASTTPTAALLEGGGLLLDVQRTEDSDTVANIVVAESTDGAIRAVAEDTNPTSPTYAGGRYGRRVVTVRNPHLHSVAQAQQLATARLVHELGRSETTALTAVPDPALDVEEIITVHRPRSGLRHRALLVATLDLPLAVTEPMRIGARRTILAADGAVLAPAAVTAP